MLNRCIFMGRLSKEPELRKTGSGVSVASFSLAVDRDVVSKESNERKTDFFDFVAWRGTAEFICKYFHKGDMICVECRAEQRSFEDKNGGGKRYVIEFNVENAYFAGSKKEGNNATQSGGYAAPAGGVYSAPAGNGYAAPTPTGYGAPAAPAPTGYGAPAAPTGYGAPAAPTGYGAPAAPAGYNAPAGYGAPAAPAGYSAPVGGYTGPVAPAGYGAPAPDYAVINDDDAKLPF